MNRYALLFLFLWQSVEALPISGQPFQYNVHNGALADATIALPVAGWGANPANTGYLKTANISFYAAEAYGISALRHGGTHLSIPLRPTVTSLHISTVGTDSYQQTKLQFAIARSLTFGSTRRVMIGLSNTLKRVGIRGYGNESTYGLSLGVSVPVASHIFLGLSGQHLIQTRKTIQLPQILGIGLAYQPISTVWLMAAVEQELKYPSLLRFGAQVHITKVLSLQYGLSTNPVKYAIGTQIKLSRLLIHLATARHLVLGWTPALSISLAFKRPKDVSSSVN